MFNLSFSINHDKFLVNVYSFKFNQFLFEGDFSGY